MPAATPPTFFFSHARQDRETPGKYLSRFFEDLEIKLAQWAGVSLKEKRLGTIDSRLRMTEDWDAELSRGLSNSRALVAVLTPLYFNRPNCGKELAVFLLRSPDLHIDQNGALKGARNVMTIRWLPENAYAANSEKEGLIPPFLRLIEDTPGDEGRDADRTRAIERYQKKGMEKCVQHEPEYSELLDLFVERIRELPELPAAAGVSFAAARDAFNYDWRNHFAQPAVAAASPTTAAVAPRPLLSVVAFYVTRRPFTRDSNTVEFADQLIAEPLSQATAHSDSSFAALLAEIRHAGVAEGLTVFHAAADPVVPENAKPLLDRLASLSAARILTVLVVDPDIWPGIGDGAASAVEEIARSLRWSGLMLVPAGENSLFDVDELAVRRGLPPRLVMLPPASEARVFSLRRAFIDVRGRVLSGSAENSPGAERVPLLKGTGVKKPDDEGGGNRQ